MKKFGLIAACIALMLCQNTKAQTNIQEMYDFGRGHFATTLEMNHQDAWGYTKAYTDIYHIQQNFPTGFYSEISRGLNFWQNTVLADLTFHVEWNGGQFARNAWLVGLEYLLHNHDYSYSVAFQVLYKNIRVPPTGATQIKGANVPLQLSAVWNMKDLLDVEGLDFCGFLDFWWENNVWDESGTTTTCTILCEPQVWYNVGQFFDCENLHIGGEVELAYNYNQASPEMLPDRKGFTIAPCLGIKWNF